MPVNPERLRKLRDFGLTEYQARVYLALLDLGTATASQVPPIARVPRTRIYATMQQLHGKGLVEIIPEAPLKYKPVPFSNFLTKRATEQRERAENLEASIAQLGQEFAITGGQVVVEAGRFEAVYGRRNARERLIKMYSSAKREAYGIGTTRSPGRIMKAFGSILQERGAEHRLLDARVHARRRPARVPHEPSDPGRRLLVPRGRHRDLDERRGNRGGDARHGGEDLVHGHAADPCGRDGPGGREANRVRSGPQRISG